MSLPERWAITGGFFFGPGNQFSVGAGRLRPPSLCAQPREDTRSQGPKFDLNHPENTLRLNAEMPAPQPKPRWHRNHRQ